MGDNTKTGWMGEYQNIISSGILGIWIRQDCVGALYFIQ